MGEPELADLLATVRKLAEALAYETRENARLNCELGGAIAEAARLPEELAAERRLASRRHRHQHALSEEHAR